MFKMLKLGHLPFILATINPTINQHNYETRQRSDFMLPFPRTQCIRESFQYQILDCWNKLDPEVRNLDSLSAFKKACHQFYLQQY